MTDEVDITQLVTALRQQDGIESVEMEVTVRANVQKQPTGETDSAFNPIRERDVGDERLREMADACNVEYHGVVDAMSDYYDTVRFRGTERYDDD
jgi:hypothetical protein